MKSLEERIKYIQTQNGQLSEGIVKEIIKEVKTWLVAEQSQDNLVWLEYNFINKLIEKLEK